MTQPLIDMIAGAFIGWLGVLVGVVVRSGWMAHKLAYKKPQPPKVTP